MSVVTELDVAHLRGSARRPTAKGSRRAPSVWAVLALFAGAGVLAVIGFGISMLLAGLMFAIGFTALAALRPRLALIFVLGTSPFVWDLGGGPLKLAVAEEALVLTLIAFLMTGRVRSLRNPLWWPIGAYLAVCAISTALNGVMDGTISSVVQMTLYMIATVLVFSAGVKGEHDVFPAIYAMVAGSLVLVGMLAVAHSNYAFGLHKNNTGSSIGFGTVAAMGLWMGESAKRRRRLITAALVILLAGLLYTLSRGSWMGVIAGSLVMVALRGQWRLALRIVLIGAPVIAIGWMLLPAESKEYATSVGADAYNTKTRLQSIEYALSFFQRSPVLGVGPGLRKNFDATNVMMTTLSETGVLGFVTFFSIFLVLGVTAWRAARRLKPNDPALVLLTIGAALMVDQLVHGMVDHYWVRGILPVWSGAGLVVYVSNQLRTNKQPRAQRI